MKKLLAMLLAVLMLLGCTAFAAAVDQLQGGAAIDFNADDTTDNSTLVNRDNISRFQQEDGTSGTVKTELWMQVAASGQIDVTVPLLLVFSTNVDGGKATEATNYIIYNNNPHNSIAVDKIEVDVEAKSQANPMQFVASNADELTDKSARDYYSVIFEPALNARTEADAEYALNSTGAQSGVTYDLYDIKTNPDTYIFNDAGETAQSLMTLGQGVSINLKPTMVTTPLTFVTNTDHGVKLLTVTYTVGLKYTDGLGSAIDTNSYLNGTAITSGGANP